MIHKTKGIVLSQVKYGETSLIVNVFTEKFGRQAYIVKGGRSKKSMNKGNLFRPFFLLDMEVYHRGDKNIQTVKEVRLSEPLNNLAFDVFKGTVTLFLAEVVSKSLREEEPNQELFLFLFNNIRYFDLCDDGGIKCFHLFFLAKLTRYLGFYPRLNRSEKTPFFDLDNGRFVEHQARHAHCLPKDESHRAHSLFITSIDDLKNLKINTLESFSLLRCILNFYAQHVEGFSSLKSLPVLKELFGNEE